MMSRTQEERAQSYLNEIHEHWGPRLELVPGSTLVMTGSDHGYTQWTIAPLKFGDNDLIERFVGESQVGVVVIDEADDRRVQIVAVGGGRVTTLEPITINPNDPRAPSAAEFEQVEASEEDGELITVVPRKLRSDYNNGA
jgi:hypothetical protein